MSAPSNMSGHSITQRYSSRATLPILPTEIITSIISHCDKATCVSLARVSRCFNVLADNGLWRELDLTLPLYYGYRPLILPHGERGDLHYGDKDFMAYHEWEQKESGRRQKRHRAGLKEKTKTILLRADERRAGAIRAITLLPRVGAVNGQLSILELASTTLESLTILPLDHSVSNRNWLDASITTHDTLDFRFINSELYLPALTHVTIASRAMYHLGFLLILLSSAPNLCALDVSRFTAYVDDGFEPSFPALQRDTQLERLRIYDLDGCDFRMDHSDNEKIITIIERSPQLQALALDPVEFSPGLQVRLLQACNKRQHLRSLYIPNDLAKVTEEYDGGRLICHSQILVLRCSQWWHAFLHLPELPTVTGLYLSGGCGGLSMELAPPAAFPEPITSSPMIPHFVDQLRRCPRLEIIHMVSCAELDEGGGLAVFDRLRDLEEFGDATMSIRSITHKGAELLHARVLQRYCQTKDRAGPPHAYGAYAFEYEAKGGMRRSKHFARQAEASYYDYTDFDGHCVPLDILAKMRLFQGASEEEWTGRGIKVGRKAWKVLTDWRDKQEAEV